MQLALQQLIIPPGHQLLIKDVSWQRYKRILKELGEQRSCRVSYSHGIMEIMTPLPEHEAAKVIIDITSRTRFNNYEALGVPELWHWNGKKLEINLLIDNKYIESDTSLIFPNLPINEIIPDYLNRSKTFGRNRTMKEFRAWILRLK
ncbi:hypothetical protein CEN49_11590 [Fischerella thermalis CCMEE 5273]|nr:hypothetical protein CEN49_11590 [Fischerella thermalis CCMEE 5273]